MYDLSILIPARNEIFISNTVADILKNKRGKTEVLVGLDGAWADPKIEDHPDVRIVYMSESIGQRAMTNKLAKLSRAKYVAKCDAHCAFSEGFDQILMDDMQDDWTMVPVMRNLWAFDWKCMKCGSKWYQGPDPIRCMKMDGRKVVPHEECDNTTNFKRKIIWKGKQSPQSTAYRFDTDLHFQYFGELKDRQQAEGGDIVETMSLQGSFFMLTRDKYWELNICDETWGSWGQQGTEVALKTWLSGGRVVVNKKAWYAHMFRTQPGFSFPYPQSGKAQHRARKISQDLFLNNKWDKQNRPLSWLLEKFWPVPGWTEADLNRIKHFDANVKKQKKPPTIMPVNTGDNKQNGVNELNLFDALKLVNQGKKITKLEWNNSNTYCWLDNTLKIHIKDKDLDWVLSDGDMAGDDWVVL